MRQEFEKNRYVDNLDVKNMLIFQGAAELEETLHMWKTQSHIMKYFKDPEEVREEREKKQDFLSEFYSGASK
jgi:NADH dehydrogenase (ubiquinone) 1 alpha subcomplex subunit 6